MDAHKVLPGEDELSDEDSFSVTSEDRVDWLQDDMFLSAEVSAPRKDPRHFFGPPLLDVDDIRLMYVEPRENFDDPIVCTMDTTSLKAPRPYQTLSYAWGTAYPDGSHLTEILFIYTQAVPITANLNTALKQLRRRWATGELGLPSSRFTIWVDAVCVDQDNVVERGRQVMMMDKIYAMSQCLIIWLGDVPNSQSTDHNTDDKLPFAKALESSWFTRRWVVQEVHMSRCVRWVLYGHWAQPLERFREQECLGIYKEPRVLRDAEETTLLGLLHLYRFQVCSDPLDRVYCLLKLSSDMQQTEVDYRITAKQCYTTIAVRYVTPKALPLLLACAGTSIGGPDATGVAGLSSWVPDWSLARESPDHREPRTYWTPFTEQLKPVTDLDVGPFTNRGEYVEYLRLQPDAHLTMQGHLIEPCAHSLVELRCLYCRFVYLSAGGEAGNQYSMRHAAFPRRWYALLNGVQIGLALRSVPELDGHSHGGPTFELLSAFCLVKGHERNIWEMTVPTTRDESELAWEGRQWAVAGQRWDPQNFQWNPGFVCWDVVSQPWASTEQPRPPSPQRPLYLRLRWVYVQQTLPPECHRKFCLV